MSSRCAEYATWVEINYPTPESAVGACTGATLRMVAAFPELKRVPGHVLTASWGRSAHWWCLTPDGQIIDPTAKQFPDELVDYDPWVAGTEVRVGRCMDCGDPIYARPEELDKPLTGIYSTSFCDQDCYGKFGAHLAGYGY
jgi:hypothetical protein